MLLVAKVFLTSIFIQPAQALLPINHIDYQNFPSTVALKVEPMSSNCTAVKVESHIFLTAAHCLEPLKVKNQRLVIYRINKKHEAVNEYTPKNLNVRLHQNYYSQNTVAGAARTFMFADNADIALFKVDVDTKEIPIQKISFDGVTKNQKIFIGGHGIQKSQKCFAYTTTPCVLSMRTQFVSSIGDNLFYTKPSKAYPGFTNSGDSGGPVYTKIENQLQVVGINVVVFPSKKQAIQSLFNPDIEFSGLSGFLNLKNYKNWYLRNLKALKN